MTGGRCHLHRSMCEHSAVKLVAVMEMPRKSVYVQCAGMCLQMLTVKHPVCRSIAQLIAHACNLSPSSRDLDIPCIQLTHDRTLTPVPAAPEGSCLPACCSVMCAHLCDVQLLRYGDAQAVFAQIFTLPPIGSSHRSVRFSASPLVYTANLTLCMPMKSSG